MKNIHPTMARVFQQTSLKPSELAHALETTPATITNWSKRGISNQGAIKVARKFDIDVNWIMMTSEELAVPKELDTNNTVNHIKLSATEKHHLSSHFETVIADLESVNALLLSIQEAIKTGHTERATKLANIGQQLTEDLIKQSNAYLDTLTIMS